ncbi:hypothetical protein JKP88DRAFT_161917 [Tribonema minus]|uniref:Uncharacterized protein n=1 Tax=Tribonema minus TaxID=303371 RepID=A0A835ZE66_9STRA|nr:hypothetical protein JKP88DRAFT_182132 [Tribonema minus]KAG5187308.1 hypothetical protein JKP88DRAFT_161917 [Tribonema minus]
MRLDGITDLSDTDVVQLLIDICDIRDARAVVYVYDKMRARRIPLSEQIKQAMRRVEADRGRTPFTLSVPANLAPHLQPSRRIHKTCKGWRIAARNSDASSHVLRAQEWVSTQPAGSLDVRSSAAARMHVAKRLARELHVPLETARGIVTSLKRTGVL